jgi:phosphopantothenate synthetase
MERLEQSDIQIPRGGIAVIHGRQDSVVPVLGSERFVARAREITGSDKVVLAIRDGDHGFDSDLRFGEEPWLQESLKTAVETWLE